MLVVNGSNSASRGHGAGWGVVLPVTSEEHVRSLAAEVLRSDRSLPIVCLTARPGETTPALSVERVRAIVGPGVPIYFIASVYLLRRLMKQVPAHLCPHSGAGRVWWPGVDEHSSPREHARIYDPDVRGEEAYERLAAEFCSQRSREDEL